MVHYIAINICDALNNKLITNTFIINSFITVMFINKYFSMDNF